MGPDIVDAEEDALQPPAALRRHAHVAGNGELLWPHSIAAEAAKWAAGQANGIWGGEVYAPRGPFTAMMVREWRTEPEWGAGEPWPRFVARALQQTLTALEAEGRKGPEGLLYFLAYAPESSFIEESRRTRPGHRERRFGISKEAPTDG